MKTHVSQSWSNYFLHSEGAEEVFGVSADLEIRHDEQTIKLNSINEENLKFDDLSIQQARQYIQFLTSAVNFAESQLKKTPCKYIR